MNGMAHYLDHCNLTAGKSRRKRTRVAPYVAGLAVSLVVLLWALLA